MMIATADQDLPELGSGDLAALRREIAALRAELEAVKGKLAEAEGVADRDPLTPLLNRRAFMRELARAQAHVARYGESCSVIYLDLEGLKAINDRFGHPAGDATLRAVAERLLQHVRASDVVGRIGGDEFAVILARTNGFQAEAKAESLTQAIAGEPVEGLSPLVRATLTWGVAEVRGDLDADAVIAEADAAMYAARAARRD